MITLPWYYLPHKQVEVAANGDIITLAEIYHARKPSRVLTQRLSKTDSQTEGSQNATAPPEKNKL